ncbi:MAG: hypothetical protein K0Q48_3620, partial [Bacillota bacterium]|nr:hypothetical protein [Bacillota bacterium]
MTKKERRLIGMLQKMERRAGEV